MSRIPLARALVHAVTHDAVVSTILEHEDDLAARRALRAPRGAPNTKPPACPACHRFVVNVSADCPCGWSPIFGWAA